MAAEKDSLSPDFGSFAADRAFPHVVIVDWLIMGMVSKQRE